MLQQNIQAAMDYITEKLGFNAWSRELHDHEQMYGFLMPPEVYANERLRKNLWKFTSNVFYAHYLSVEETYLMPDSTNQSINEIMGEEIYDNRYDVDWHGSRHRRVELGPHIFFRLAFTGWFGRDRADPEPPQLPLDSNGNEIAWEIVEERPDCYTDIQYARIVLRTQNLGV